MPSDDLRTSVTDFVTVVCRLGGLMNETLFELLLERLTTETLAGDTCDLVLAACHGPSALKALLDEGRKPDLPETRPDIQVEPPGALLRSLRVGGFRGIGPEVSLEFQPAPGLTLVTGRNGTGKSSLAEGLELLLTGESQRWGGKRSQIWKEGWRNLHQGGDVTLAAEFVLEGHAGPLKLNRRWAPQAALDASALEVQPHGQPKSTLEGLGWTRFLNTHRPIMSYNELGSMLDEGPSKLYDALTIALGLDDLVATQKHLKDERSAAETLVKDVARERAELAAALEPLQDLRAKACFQAMGKKPDLEAVTAQFQGDARTLDQGPLRELAALTVPRAEDVAASVRELRDAEENLRRLAGTNVERARLTAGLLQKALELPETSDCPVCRRPGGMDGTWRADTEKEVARLKEEAQEAEAAQSQGRQALDRARRHLIPVPGVLSGSARETWARWTVEYDTLTELANHLESGLLEQLSQEIALVAAEAQKELAARDSEWSAIHPRLTAWLEKARRAALAEPQVRQLKAAEAWLKEATDALRNDRFSPIGDAALRFWETLRQDSNVELGNITLAGTSKQRRVTLDVTIDGVAGAALAVMSQGELNALALSLFLPRATLPESPFRFVVIDDPVQSMDPARVDGLARVLEQTAKTRQVIVFTHDARLSDAVRRLGIAANIVELKRRENSVVEQSPALDPVRRALEDARCLVSTPGMAQKVAGRVIPGFCREAVEAACVDVTRRRRLGRGERFVEVEELLERAETLREKAALAWFDTKARVHDVGDELDKHCPGARRTLTLLNKGSHGEDVGPMDGLIRDTDALTKVLLKRK